MKSRTSFFNATAFRKDILRYSPIWVLYTLFLLLVLFGEADYSRAVIARDFAESLQPMGWINLFYGGICAVFLFMDLFNGRLCNALHAFPMRREGWLTTHLLSGFLFSFVPNLLAAGIGALLLWEYAYIAPIWLAISTLQYLFFFGTAALAVTCAGNLLGTVAVYGMIHFITYFIYVVTDLLYQPLLYGVRLSGNGFFRFFPLGEMSGYDFVALEVLYNDVKPALRFEGLIWNEWLYVGLCAVAGVAAMYLARQVYRRRNLETAGDFISLKPLAPLFILVCTVGAGAFLYMFSELVGSPTYLFLVLGMIIGYFAGKMFLNRTLKVFGKKSILTLVAVMAVFGGSLLLTWIDPLGITTYVPQTENVEAVYIYGADKGYYYYSNSHLAVSTKLNENDFAFTDPEEIADWQDFHRELTKYRPSDDDGVLCDVEIFYKLKSGRIVSRYYEVGRDTELGKKAGKCFSDMRYIFEVSDTQILYDAFKAVDVEIYWSTGNRNFELTDPQEINGLLDAMALDCQAGKMAQNWAYHEDVKDVKEDDSYVEAYVNFEVKSELYDQDVLETSGFRFRIYNDSTNTHAYLAVMRQLDEYKHTAPDTPQLDENQ